MATRIRRTFVVTKPDNKELAAQLKSIAEWLATAERAAERIKEHEEKIWRLMKKDSLTEFETEEAKATIYASAGKKVNIIDPKKLRAKLKDDAEFFACTTVSVTKVKEFLGAKEIEKITTSIPPKVGEPKLKVTLKV